MDRRELLFGASALGLVTNLNLNHPLIAQVGNAVMGSRRLTDRERAGLRGPVKTCSDPTGAGIGSINTDYDTDGRLLGYRARCPVVGGLGRISDYVDVPYEFYDKESNKTKVGRLCRPDVDDELQYDARGRKTRVRKVSPSSNSLGFSMFNSMILDSIISTRHRTRSEMFEAAEAGGFPSGGGTVTTSYNENDQPIESLICNANGELLTKVNQNYKNGRLISETLVAVRLSEPQVITRRELERQMQEEIQRTMQEERFSENEEAREEMAKRRAFWDQLQGRGMKCSYTYDADDRVIRILTQVGDSKEDERKTYNEQGDVDWTLMIGSGFDDERSEFRYLYQYDSHGNWTERTKINADRPDNPNTQRRTLAYY